MNVLVVDIGGTRVKLLATGKDKARSFDSWPEMQPAQMVQKVRETAGGWAYDAVALGIPAVVGTAGPVAEPGNLGDGWVGFDYARAFGKPVRVANDAAMQALGAYDGGRMLFLGLGTGLGSALVAKNTVIPLELGRLRMGRRDQLGQRLGKAGLESMGAAAWVAAVTEAAEELRDALEADYVVLGGGNARHVDPLPDKCRRGGNEDAFAGGFRLWEEDIEHHDGPPPAMWRVVG